MPSAGACPQKLSKCTYFREEREESRVGRESLPRTAIVAANQLGRAAPILRSKHAPPVRGSAAGLCGGPRLSLLAQACFRKESRI